MILLIDDYSPLILGYRLLEQTSIDVVMDLLAQAVRRYGKMEEILTDRGFVFYSWRGANRLERYLETERIDHPQEQYEAVCPQIRANTLFQNFRKQNTVPEDQVE